MSKGLSVALIVLLGGACLLLTGLMPLAELGALNPTAPEGVAKGIVEAVEPIRAAVVGMTGSLSQDPNFQYYIYALFLGLAMTVAAIAINVIGREDSEEKTVLPLKK